METTRGRVIRLDGSVEQTRPKSAAQ
jgi:hypothetical protein